MHLRQKPRSPWQRTSNFSGGAVHTGQRSRVRPACCAGIHDRGLPRTQPCTARQVGEPVGLIVVAARLRNNLSQPDGGPNAKMFGLARRPDRQIDSNAAIRRGTFDRHRPALPARRTRTRLSPSHDGVGCSHESSITPGCAGPDEQHGRSWPSVVATHPAVPAPSVRRRRLARQPARPCCRNGPCAIRRRSSGPCTDSRGIPGRQIHAEHQPSR